MDISFHLPSLPIPRLTETMLQQPLKILKEISDVNRIRFEQGYETKVFKNRKEELVRRLKNRKNTNQSFEEATDVSGRERLLLSIYLDHLSQHDRRNWLPDFDNTIARSIMGEHGRKWHSGQVSLLFFSHFDNVAALPFLCDRLIESHSNNVSNEFEKIRHWHEHRKLIFSPNGPENIASRLGDGESIQSLMTRYSIPNQGRFGEKLRQVALLNKVKKIPFGVASPDFIEIEKLRNERVSDKLLVGSAALKILIERVSKEGRGNWSGDWPDWITRFGCDPRYSRSSAEVNKWWNWATESEFRLAQQGVNWLTIIFFIKFLRNSLSGTDKEAQFNRRSQFLMALFHSGKINRTRILLNQTEFQNLDRKYHDSLFVARLRGTSDHTSMICLSCTNDIFIIEGTHSFGLRSFYQSFPIREFWDKPRQYYYDKDLRLTPTECPIFLRHDQSGNWTHNFFREIYGKFGVNWNDVNI